MFKLRSICALFIAVSIFSSCKKEADNIFNMFTDVNVTFHGDHPYSVTDYKLLEDGDSVYVDYTITSAKEDMYTVVVELVGATSATGLQRTATVVTDASERRSYSRTLKTKMQRDGKATYRVYALNQKGHYIGDGDAKVTVEGKPSFNIVSNRRIYTADTVAIDQASFYSIMRGETFTYDSGQANSADIDFGIWSRRDPRPGQESNFIYNYYSISASPNPFTPYDISNWDKRVTLFSNPVTNQTNNFLYSWVSGDVIEEQAKSRTLDVISTNFETFQAGLFAGNAVFFQTPEGKYGVFLVNATSSDLQGKRFVNITVKVQK